MRIAGSVAAAVVLCAVRLAAHDGDAHVNGDARAFSPWDIGAVCFLLTIGILYARGSLQLRARGATHPGLEQAAFACGWFALMAAVLPPLDALAAEWFSAHMAQHELMMLIGAPLIIAGRPFPVWLWGLPASLRHRAAGVFQSRSLATPWRAMTSPIVAWGLHAAVLWSWHLPVAYELAVRHEGIHAIQHATFIGTSALFWWGLLYGRYGRAGYGAAVFYVFTTAVHTGLLGAMFTFADRPLYGLYSGTAAAHGADALGDQQVAGLLMWIPAGLVLTMLGIGLFAAWLGEAERRSRLPGYDT